MATKRWKIFYSTNNCCDSFIIVSAGTKKKAIKIAKEKILKTCFHVYIENCEEV